MVHLYFILSSLYFHLFFTSLHSFTFYLIFSLIFISFFTSLFWLIFLSHSVSSLIFICFGSSLSHSVFSYFHLSFSYFSVLIHLFISFCLPLFSSLILFIYFAWPLSHSVFSHFHLFFYFSASVHLYYLILSCFSSSYHFSILRFFFPFFIKRGRKIKKKKYINRLTELAKGHDIFSQAGSDYKFQDQIISSTSVTEFVLTVIEVQSSIFTTTKIYKRIKVNSGNCRKC